MGHAMRISNRWISTSSPCPRMPSIPWHDHRQGTAPSIDRWFVSSMLSTPLSSTIAPCLQLHQASPTPASSLHGIASIHVAATQHRAGILSSLHNITQESHRLRLRFASNPCLLLVPRMAHVVFPLASNRACSLCCCGLLLFHRRQRH